jgi:hypothetical protein
MNIYTSETEYLKTEVQRLRALVRAQQITIDKLEAQPEQEPVALYVYKPALPRGHLGNVSDGDLPWVYDQDPSSGYSARMLVYTTPPQRKPLTDKQILADETLRYYFGLNGGAGPVSKQGRKIVNAIEAFHNIKEIEK